MEGVKDFLTKVDYWSQVWIRNPVHYAAVWLWVLVSQRRIP